MDEGRVRQLAQPRWGRHPCIMHTTCVLEVYSWKCRQVHCTAYTIPELGFGPLLLLYIQNTNPSKWAALYYTQCTVNMQFTESWNDIPCEWDIDWINGYTTGYWTELNQHKHQNMSHDYKYSFHIYRKSATRIDSMSERRWLDSTAQNWDSAD